MKYGIDVAQHQMTYKALYGDPSSPCFEGWTALAALAARTESCGC